MSKIATKRLAKRIEALIDKHQATERAPVRLYRWSNRELAHKIIEMIYPQQQPQHTVELSGADKNGELDA